MRPSCGHVCFKAKVAHAAISICANRLCRETVFPLKRRALLCARFTGVWLQLDIGVCRWRPESRVCKRSKASPEGWRSCPTRIPFTTFPAIDPLYVAEEKIEKEQMKKDEKNQKIKQKLRKKEMLRKKTGLFRLTAYSLKKVKYPLLFKQKKSSTHAHLLQCLCVTVIFLGVFGFLKKKNPTGKLEKRKKKKKSFLEDIFELSLR